MQLAPGIQRYSVVPLSTNSGLIEWVPQCDTLHALVRDYRTRRNIMINVEHRLMLHYAPDLDALSLMQKVEVFKYALAHTEGMDLYRVLWTKAPPPRGCNPDAPQAATRRNRGCNPTHRRLQAVCVAGAVVRGLA